MLPKLTQQFDLTPEDFTRHAVWISVHNYDSDEAWYDDADEETFRPWMGVLPFGEHRGMALAKAIFKLADGTVHPGYFTTESSQWDNARLSGTRRRPPPADILHRQCPTIFVNNGAFDFQLREPHLRDAAISNFFSAIGKKPGEVFPVRFATDGTTPDSGDPKPRKATPNRGRRPQTAEFETSRTDQSEERTNPMPHSSAIGTSASSEVELTH